MTYRTMREPTRAIPADHVRLPRFRWPSEAHSVPSRCEHCGGKLIVEAPTAAYPISDVVCLACSRAACELQLDGPETLTRDQLRALPGVQGKRGPKPRYSDDPVEGARLRMRAFRDRHREAGR